LRTDGGRLATAFARRESWYRLTRLSVVYTISVHERRGSTSFRGQLCIFETAYCQLACYRRTWKDISYCSEGRFDGRYLSCILEDIRIIFLDKIHLAPRSHPTCQGDDVDISLRCRDARLSVFQPGPTSPRQIAHGIGIILGSPLASMAKCMH
jgi:hypothetical protein